MTEEHQRQIDHLGSLTPPTLNLAVCVLVDEVKDRKLCLISKVSISYYTYPLGVAPEGK